MRLVINPGTLYTCTHVCKEKAANLPEAHLP